MRNFAGGVFTVPEVAKILSLSPNRVRTLIRTGKLFASKIGPRTQRITKGSLDAFLGHYTEAPAYPDRKSAAANDREL